MDVLNWLQEWYRQNCTDKWEHFYGVKINTLDNPGWYVKIDLADTTLENKKFSEIKIDNGDNDWIFCKVENSIFEGCGDSTKLTALLETFQDWAMNSFDFV